MSLNGLEANKYFYARSATTGFLTEKQNELKELVSCINSCTIKVDESGTIIGSTNYDGCITHGDFFTEVTDGEGYTLHLYTCDEWNLIGIAAVCDKSYDAGDKISKDDFTVKAYYSSTENALPTNLPTEDNATWHIVTLSQPAITTTTGDSTSTTPAITNSALKVSADTFTLSGDATSMTVAVNYGKDTTVERCDVTLYQAQYALNVTEEGGSGAVTFTKGNSTVTEAAKGDEININIKPDEGYAVESVKVNGETLTSSESTYTFTVDKDDYVNTDNIIPVKITYKGVESAVTIGDHQNGSLSLSQESGSIASGASVAAGTEITVDATANTDYYLSSITVQGTNDSSKQVSVNGNSFIMPAFPVTVSAQFVKKTDDMVDLNQLLGGTTGSTTGSSNRTLVSGDYYLSGNLTLNGNTKVGNGLRIANNAYVKIYLNGYTLTANGQDATSGVSGKNGVNGSGKNDKGNGGSSTVISAGGYAGILLPKSATLIFAGNGVVYANGGAAGDGGAGGNGGNGYARQFFKSSTSGGQGGFGGSGGGGAGAGIGTNGTASALNGSSAVTPAAAGTLLVYQDAANAITMNLNGGSNGDGGAAGSGGNGDSDWKLFGSDISAQGGAGGDGGDGGNGGAGYGAGGAGGSAGAGGVGGASSNNSGSYNTSKGNGSGGDNGSAASQGAYSTYTLEKLTVESRYAALYNGDGAEKYKDTDLTAQEALDVWAVYKNNSDLSDLKYWQLKKAKTDTPVTSETGTYYKTFARYDATVATAADKSKATIIATYVPMNDGNSSFSVAETAGKATTDVLLGTKTAMSKNMAEGAEPVTLGDAAKYNDGKTPLNYQNAKDTSKNISGAAWKIVNYKGAAYLFADDASSDLTLKSTEDVSNKLYSVTYTPYNTFAYDGDSAWNWNNLNKGTYAELKNVQFKNAGLYTISVYNNRSDVGTNSTAANLVTTYYIVIQQADLGIMNATDTVTNNTTVYDHSFDRTVVGQNGDSVLGEYVFPSNAEGSRADSYCKNENWGNLQTLSVNKNNTRVNDIEWEFNIKATYDDGSGTVDNKDGDRNQNNYLDQNDGPNVSIAKTESGKNYTRGGIEIANGLTAAKNSFYSGSNGVLLYDESGIAVIESNENLKVNVKYEGDQKILKDGSGADYSKTDWDTLDTKAVKEGKIWNTTTTSSSSSSAEADTKTTPISSVFAEDVAIGAEFSDGTAGFRVNAGDAVSGAAFGGTPVSSIPVELKYAGGTEDGSADKLSGADLLAKLVSDSKTYKGDYYVVTITDKADKLIKMWDYNDISTSSTASNIASGSAYALDDRNAYDALQAGTYTVTVQYVGLYYTNNTPTEARQTSAWTGSESFNWVTAEQSFTLEVEPRNVAYKTLEDINKVYDGTDLIVKDTMSTESTGDVESASGYIIDLLDGAAAGALTQFLKGLNNNPLNNWSGGEDVLYNYLQPTDGKYGSSYHTHMALEIAGTYASKDTGAYGDTDKAITVSSSRLLDAGENDDYNNYNLIPVSNQSLKGKIYTAQMYVTHNMTGSVTIRDYTPMRDMLNLHVKAYMPVTNGERGMAYATEGDNKGYLTGTVEFKKIELVAKDDLSNNIDGANTAITGDATTGDATKYPVNSDTNYDYDASYKLINDSHSESLIKVGETGTGFAIDEATGEVTSVADKTSNQKDPKSFPKITLNLKDFGNYVLVKQSEDASAYPTDTFGACEETTANGPRTTTANGSDGRTAYPVATDVSVSTRDEGSNTLTHTLRYKIVGNENTFDLILPINQLNNRASGGNSAFVNETGDSSISVGEEAYKYVTLYENGDSAEFSFTIPQDSYLKDVLIVAVEKGSDGNDIAASKGNLPAFASVDNSKVVGKFSVNTNGEISTKYKDGTEEKDCVLNLKLTGVNNVALSGSDFADKAYFGASAADGAGYSAYKLADANKQKGGSTYSFMLTTGKSDLGSNFNIMIVPVFEEYGALIDDAAEGAYKANVSVEKTVDKTTGAVSDSDVEDYVYVNFKTLWSTNSYSENPSYGEVELKYGDVSTTKTISSNSKKDECCSISFNAEETEAKNFFNPETLIPGTEVAVTITAWRNGVVDGLQKDTSDDDATHSVTFTWTVSQEDYYRLFADDVIVFRSSNAKDTTSVTTEMSNVTGYGIVADAEHPEYTDLTKVKFVPNTAKATVSEKNMLSSYGSEVYRNNATEKSTLTDNKLADLALGDSIYLKKPASSSGGSGGGGGTAVSANGDIDINKTTNGTVTAETKGDTVTLTVSPDKGYTLETLTVLDKNGKEIELVKKSETEYTFKAQSDDVTINATFMDDNTMLNYFVDVNAKDYFYDAVLWAAENGITTGMDDTHFGADLDCTRAQIVTLLWRAAGSPESDFVVDFVDVASGSYYAKAVAWAVENGVAKGTSDTTFEPDKICTRAQCVTFISRALDGKADTQAAFTDVARSAYYAGAVDWAAENNVTTGVSDTRFAPDDNCTRGQIVTFLWRAYVK